MTPSKTRVGSQIPQDRPGASHLCHGSSGVWSRLRASLGLTGLLVVLTACRSTSSLSSGSVPGAEGAAILVEHARGLGMAWPLQLGGLAALLGGLALFILGRRPGGLMLLGIGVLLCTVPGWILEVFHRVTWLGAASVGALLVMGVGWVGHKLFKMLKIRKERRR